jgi:HEAT repeat protein/TolA-binding protein
MRLTLMQVLMVTAAAPMVASAQVPPTPPRAPTPAPKPPVVVTPRIKIDPEFELWGPKLHELRWHIEDMRLHELEMPKLDFEYMKMQAKDMELLAKEQAKFHVEEMKLFAKVDVEHIRAEAEAIKHQFAQVDIDAWRHQAEEVAHQAKIALPVHFDMPRIEPFGPGIGRDKFLEARPRQGWNREDPADSLYRVAREALNRGEYRRAAQTFNEVTKKYPRSQYALHSAYWEAFARYRNGGTDDLKEALKILDEKSQQFASMGDDGNVDVQALRARVLGALAARGDAKAAEELRKNPGQSGSCDREDVSVRAEALSALAQMDMAAAMPTVKKVLQRRDECTVELRRRALYLIARQPTSEAIGLILDVAKNDTDNSIRGEAMRWLPRVAGDSAVPQLEELLRTAQDEQTQRSVISALGSIDSDRARRAVRTIIERNDAAERVRYDAILSLSRERDGRVVTPEESVYLRALFTRLEQARLREAVLTSVGRIQTSENEQFLMSVARNTNETPSLRAAALSRLGRMTNVSVVDIGKLYDVADSRGMREQILRALSERKEPEAIDKMIEIAKKDTDPQIRRTAVNLISRSAQNGNERAKKFLQEFFDR